MIRMNAGCSTIVVTGLWLSCATISNANPVLTPGIWKDITPPGLNLGSGTFGVNDVQFDPSNTSILYASVDQRGLYKSMDGGSTWNKIGELDSPLHLRVDPNDSRHLFCVQGVRGSHIGFWVSTDGGATWTKPASFTSTVESLGGGFKGDCYSIAVDPTDFNHVLVTFHYAWGTGNSGVLESKDGGTSWIVHNPVSSWGTGHHIEFLYNPALNQGNSQTWLLGTQGNGFWRTSNSGATWTQVSTSDITHGGADLYISVKTGFCYVGFSSGIMRSTDNGISWQGSTSGVPYASYYSVIGDGNSLYTMQSFGCVSYNAPYLTSPESDGTRWTPYNGGTQKFSSGGPYNMTFDTANRIIYSANWCGGVWALRVIDPSTGVIKRVSGETGTGFSILKNSSFIHINSRLTLSEKQIANAKYIDIYDIQGTRIGRKMATHGQDVRLDNTEIGHQALIVNVRE